MWSGTADYKERELSWGAWYNPMSLLKAELFLQMITEGKIREIINVTQGRFPITGMAQARPWEQPLRGKSQLEDNTDLSPSAVRAKICQQPEGAWGRIFHLSDEVEANNTLISALREPEQRPELKHLEAPNPWKWRDATCSSKVVLPPSLWWFVTQQ